MMFTFCMTIDLGNGKSSTIDTTNSIPVVPRIGEFVKQGESVRRVISVIYEYMTGSITLINVYTEEI